jgi:hypothetical protein
MKENKNHRLMPLATLMAMEKKSRVAVVARSKTAREMFEEKDQRWRAETQAIREYENRPDDETPWWQVKGGSLTEQQISLVKVRSKSLLSFS